MNRRKAAEPRRGLGRFGFNFSGSGSDFSADDGAWGAGFGTVDGTGDMPEAGPPRRSMGLSSAGALQSRLFFCEGALLVLEKGPSCKLGNRQLSHPA